MTNEELDEVRAEEAWNIIKRNEDQDVALIAARLAREGWTPPVVVDPDLAEAITLAKGFGMAHYIPVLEGIKRGRELERAEAQPRMVWVKHDGSDVCPVSQHTQVTIYGDKGSLSGFAKSAAWRNVTHYAIITQPEEK